MTATALIALAFLINIAFAWQNAPDSQFTVMILAVSIVGIIIAVWSGQNAGKGNADEVQNLANKLRHTTAKLEKGDVDNLPEDTIGGSPEFAPANQSLTELLGAIRETHTHQTREYASLKKKHLTSEKAVQTATTHLMFADENYNIVYLNDSLKSMLATHEAKLAAHFSGFKLSTLIGSNIDIFHKAPSHQRNILDNLKGKFSSEISVGDLLFGLTINPVVSEEGVRTGTVVEWQDLSDRAAAEELRKENQRISTALGSVSTNVMLADPDYNIIYLNDSLRTMMNKYVEKFRTIRSDFDPDHLLGKCIDIFHKNPAHQRKVLDSLTSTYEAEITLVDIHLKLTANPVIDEQGNRLGTTLEWADITFLKQQEVVAKENARIKVALDNVTNNIMVADDNLVIVYLNQAVVRMLRNAASDIRKDLPHFDPDNLLGKNIDVFHKNPEHQRMMLAKLESPYKTKIIVGGRHFNLIATPVKSEAGVRIGTVVEWNDITAQVIVEQEVEKLVSDVSEGRLGALISTEGKDGFFLNVSNGLNDLSQTINAFVKDVSAAMLKLSTGDLNISIDNQYQGNFGEVATALNDTVAKLNEVLGNIKLATDSIRSSNHEISIGNDQLSDRTEKQASNLEETAASLEQLTSNVRNTADNATTANQAANSAREQARNGESIVTEAVQSMSAIKESSNKIVEIISVIDDIAFQTNLLALNASVEAARAGEQGRGFAVVANEVRNLAQRSAVSAKEIKELIDVSSARVNTGSDQVNKCGEALKDILTHVDELSTLIADIANSTNEQAAGIGQVNQAVAELDDITQQNAALAEEASSASQSSVQQVDDMVEIVSFFQLDGEASAAPRVPRAAPPVARSKPISKPKPKVSKPSTSASAPISSSYDDSDDDWQEF
ncbi:PAS domain-containing protein [Paraneptunicella aestuarii]|uniref:methyl-accepting chemotaxis protein n=1 Tax=Paraneptunicella aestuarii TaxID=2831148 RepID=UPI001E5DE331|nr:methyl-accepting chemotaxis protein [Paraneptunicella aestuarii]UAA38746.1 PAS domain-containing protein [Paraneptunicella aestuarii]